MTFLGAIRALKNPYLIESGFYRRAVKAVLISIGIQFLLWLPIWTLRFFVKCIMLIASEAASDFLSSIIDGLEFIEHNVLDIGLFLVSAVRFFQPDMDNMFLMSLQFVDGVYKKKHPETTRNFYNNLLKYHGGNIEAIAGPRPVLSEKKSDQDGYPQLNENLHSAHAFGNPHNAGTGAPPPLPPRDPVIEKPQIKIDSSTPQWEQYFDYVVALWKNNQAFAKFLKKYFKRSGISLAIYFVSGIPYIGFIALPLFSFYSFNKVVGTPTALGIFAMGLSVRRRYMFMFLSTFWGGRSLVHDLLSPYFSRVPFSRTDRDQWFKAREGIMFGFGFAFYWVMKIPFVGVLAYGIAEASSAYLITKVSEPLPPPGPELYDWVQNEITWTKQDKFLSGATLNTDGFGETVNIPGGWVS